MGLGLTLKSLIVSVVGLITGVIALAVFPKIVRGKIAEILPLRPNSESWERWEKTPVPIFYRFYVFAVENPEEIIKGKNPIVKEIGPYVYRETQTKKILWVDEGRSRAAYDQQATYEFDQEASGNLTEDDVILVPNAPIILYSQVLENLKRIDNAARFLNTSVHKMWPTPDDGNPLFVKVKVKDFLFKGLPILCNQEVSLENLDVKILCEAIKIIAPRTIGINDLGDGISSFALLKYKNNTSSGIFEIDLGIHDVTKIGQIIKWNNFTMLSDWRGESCNRIIGTDITVYRPYLEEDKVESLYIFHTDVCRTIKITYEGDTEFKGVKARRYIMDQSLFATVTENSDNYCYCPQSVRGITRYGGCLRSGLLELSSCQGAPVIFSHPHFLMADPSYLEKVQGLKPEVDKHRTFLDLEPYTGYPLRAANRIQVNAFLQKIPDVKILENLPNTLMPIIWLEQSVELTDELIGVINSQLLNIVKIVKIVIWVVIAAGISSTLLFSFYFLKNRRKQK